MSKKPIDPEWMGAYINQFWAGVTLLNNSKESKAFLKDLLTHTETKMFAKRLQIARMLIEGYGYQQIQYVVKVTSNTISKISNALNDRGDGYRKIVNQILKLEKKSQRPKIPSHLRPLYTPEGVILKAAAAAAVNQGKKVIRKSQKKKSAQKLLS